MLGASATSPAATALRGGGGLSSDRAASALLTVTALGGLLALALVVALPLERGGSDLAGRLAATAFVLGMTGLAAAGTVLVRRRRHARMGWLLLLTGVTGVLARANVGAAVAAAVWSWPGALPLAWLTNWAWVPAQALATVVLMRFPDGQLPGRRWRYVERLVVGWGVLTVLATAVYPGELGAEVLAPVTNPLGVEALDPVLAPGLSALFAAMPLLLVAAVAAMAARWRRAPADQRQQLGWVVAAAAALALVAPFAVLSRRAEVLEGLAYLALPAAIAVAVLRYRLWDLGLVVRRSLVFTVVSAVLAAVYLVLVLALDRLAGDRGWLSAGTAAVVVAAVAVPVRTVAQQGLDRMLFGNRRDPYVVVRDLGARLEAAGADVLEAMVRELRRSLRLGFVAVESPGGRILARAGAEGPEGLRVPLVRSGQEVARLVVGRRSAGEPLTPVDVRLLEDLAGHAAVAVQAALLDEELRRSYQRLRSVREVERARLRRELHDGLGPVLGSVTMRAEAARNMVRRSDDRAAIDGVLAGVGAETETAVREVRRLIEELHPTALGERGLAGGLVDYVERYVHQVEVDLRVADDLPATPPEVDLAVYRVVTEAVRNADRHSRGRTCSVSVSSEGADLVVEVSDDGQGLGDAVPGVGLTAMRERAEEVGAELELASDGRGVRVRLRVPLEAS